MMYKVLIRNNETKEERLRFIESDWEDISLFYWTEGNFGCDCNRALQFASAKNEDDEKAWGQPCGRTKYSVLWAELPSGEKIIIDKIR